MAHQSESARFQALFEPAFRAYEKMAGISLTQHPLAIKLQSCDSVEAITGLMQEQAQLFGHSQGSDKIMKSLKTIVSILYQLSSAASLVDAFGLTFPPAKAIVACLAILLDSAKGIVSNCDALVDLLESVEHFLNRLSIYTRVPPSPAMDEIVVKVLVELISTLALVTEELKQRGSIKFVKRFFKEKDIEAVLERLDRLTQDEAQTAARTLAIVHGLVQNMREFMNDGKASIDGVREDLKILHQMASDMNKSRHDELLSKIRSWLAPPDPWKNYNIGRGSRYSETGAWFVNSSTLSEWKASGPSSLLWIHGKPGAGKSVLCSTIIKGIEDMQKSGLALLAMFYYDFREEEKKDLRGLLSSVLFQLCNQSHSYYSILTTFYSTCLNGARSPSNDELIRCLKDLLNLRGQAPIYLIVDALDECPNTSLPSQRDQLLELLEDLVNSKFPNLRICVTSRPESDIKPILQPLTFRSVSLHDEAGQMEDIENYIKSIVNTDNSRMRRWKSEHRQLVIDVLTERADGMFRWVHCQLEYLARCLPGRIRHALDELPSTLDATYERTLNEIHDTNWEFARRLLHCVAVVSRPLRVEELAEFLAFDFNVGQIPKYCADWRLEDPVDAVLSTCSTLLSLVNTEDSQVIQFSHFSVKEFLTSARFSEKNNTISSRYHVSMTPAHALVAKACLGVLLHLDEDITVDTLPKYPLAEYAAEHWFEHARFEGVSQSAGGGMSQIFDSKKPHLAVWLWICDPTDPFSRQNERANAPSTPNGTPLHYAAFCGLYEVVKVLAADHGQDVNSRSFIGEETPLHLTSRVGHTDLVRFLIKHGADAAAESMDGTTPLHEASEAGHVDVARLLIENGANAAAHSNDGSWTTPLHRASEWGHVDMARLLIKHGAGVKAQNAHGRTPLHWTSSRGHVDVARLLFEHGADAKAQSNDGTTPLHQASEWGHVGVARLLIEHGADVAAQGNDGTTPLHVASSGGHVDVAQLLIEHGADAAAQSNDGSTPLHRASFGGHDDLVRLLIEHGAEAATQSHDGATPLHRASFRGHVDVARLLIKHGADAAAQNEDGTTLLHRASEGGHVDVAQLLIEHGADAAAQSEDGTTPLHSASEGGHVDVARLLIRHGADAAAQSKDGTTPLRRASLGGHVDVAQLLIEHGADVAAQSEDGTTPLHSASERGHVDLARLLIEHGAKAAAQSKDGTTPLHRASFGGHVDVAQLLIKHDADVAAQREDGTTPLHSASERGHVDLAHLLLKHGANARAQSKDGTSPLHRVSERGHVDLARLLIEHGADVAAQRRDGTTPVRRASDRGYLDLVRLLIEHGADKSGQSEDGTTLLHRTSKRDDVGLAQLIGHSANAAAQSKDRVILLHWSSFGRTMFAAVVCLVSVGVIWMWPGSSEHYVDAAANMSQV